MSFERLAAAILAIGSLATAASQWLDRGAAEQDTRACSETISAIVEYHVQREADALAQCRRTP